MKLKVLTLNIHKGFSLFNSRFTLHELKSALLQTDADIVFLQEVVGENLKLQKQHPDWPEVTQSEFLSDPQRPHHVYGKNAIYHQRHHGNAILSRFPIEFAENISLSTYKLEQRGLLHCSVKIPELKQSLHLFNVHLDLTHLSRKKQLEKIIDRARTHVPPGCPLILAGDFNDWNQKSSAIIRQSLKMEEAFKSHAGQYPPSFPSFWPVLRLDRFYYRDLNLNSAKAWQHPPWSNISDHLPLSVDFDL